MKLPHHTANVAGESFQFLEDLATACWHSEVLFAAMDLNIFELLEGEPCSARALAEKTGWDCDGLERLLKGLVAFELLVEHKGSYANGPLATRFLTTAGTNHAGDFLRYRRCLVPHWQRLARRVRDGSAANRRPENESQEEYADRVFQYVRALDFQARLKAAEALEAIPTILDRAPVRILDLGGGAGSWSRAFVRKWNGAGAVLFDLPEVLEAAQKLYPAASDWQGIDLVPGNAMEGSFGDTLFDMVLLSNILHAYGEKEAGLLLARALQSLAPGGVMLIHDYIADAHQSSPHKGRLYDLHMMLNTYNGRVYALEEITTMLSRAGLKKIQLLHLQSDTSLIAAWRNETDAHRVITAHDRICAEARKLGFDFARIIKCSEVALEPWVRVKCQFGCAGYNASKQCPPFSPDEKRTKEILASYTHALIVQSTPPSREFHERLLSLERSLFLLGHYEALAFGAGPCSLCSSCRPEERCRFPDKARPSMEACGVDVYKTARRAGLPINPVSHPSGYVKYIGMVLLNEE